ncbi:hypothetical protein T265_02845 [Opisthorchis viverrini]|uniref:Uncharacterized protein n=1 Tax=Opisthorchis viverrini TaxID=6198 RepID=A0A074ZUL1_OPIVI|nr:hypothetical protein T265_02845 [Opisthorchis viverrini]KER30806.1 hypothetical protein T265_02845 [Opisthorchis viverrini]
MHDPPCFWIRPYLYIWLGVLIAFCDDSRIRYNFLPEFLPVCLIDAGRSTPNSVCTAIVRKHQSNIDNVLSTRPSEQTGIS